jgi:hypothetical protein
MRPETSDPALPAPAIGWPGAAECMVVSERDRRLPRLAAQPDLFEDGR